MQLIKSRLASAVASIAVVLALQAGSPFPAGAQEQEQEPDPEQAELMEAEAMEPAAPGSSLGAPETATADPEQAEALGVTAAPTPAAAGGRLGFVWANNATAASYTPSPTYSYNSSGGPISINRSGTGQYSVRFAGLGGSGRLGGHVQVTGYGSDNRDCKVYWWSSGGSDFVANIRCLAPNGSLADALYTVLVIWQG